MSKKRRRIDPKDIPFQELMENLRDPAAPLRAALVYRLSEPTEEEMSSFRAVWPTVPVERRRKVMTRLAETIEDDFEMNYEQVGLFALDDEDPEVRAAAIEALWIHDDTALMQRLIHMMEMDESALVRAGAAAALGRFVLLGDMEEMERPLTDLVEEALLRVWDTYDEPIEVRRRVLESLAFSGREEVASLIEEALGDHDIKMRASAVFAMGRSGHERWADQVITALDDEEPEIRYEAARAAGELGLVEARSRLIELLYDRDREVQENAIWALGEIGGHEAEQALLRMLDRAPDEAFEEMIEDALSMAALMRGDLAMYITSDPDLDEEEYLEEEEPLEDDDLSDYPDQVNPG